MGRLTAVPLPEFLPGETVRFADPVDGIIRMLYFLIGSTAAIPASAPTMFVDTNWAGTVGSTRTASWLVAAANIDASLIATGEHIVTLEWLTDDITVTQPRHSIEATFTTTESLLRARGIDPICVVPGGTAPVTYRGITTDGLEVEVDPFSIDLDGTGTLSPDGLTFTAGASEIVGYTDIGICPIVVRQNRGMANFAADGSVQYGYSAGAEIHVCVFLFGPLNFDSDAWGTVSGGVRDQLLAAGVVLEDGTPARPPCATDADGPGVPLATFLTLYAAGPVPVDNSRFANWPGKWVLTCDSLLGGSFQWVPNYAASSSDRAAVFQAIADHVADLGTQCVLVAAVDETNTRYGNDPTNTAHPNLTNLATLSGGLATLVSEMRAADFPPIMWPLDGVSIVGKPPRDYAGWPLPAYSDGVDQYQTAIRNPSILRGGGIQTDWGWQTKNASRYRDPSRPFSTDYALTMNGGYTADDGVFDGTNLVGNTGGWQGNDFAVNLGIAVVVGAVLPRGYFLEKFLYPQTAGVAGEFVQRAVRPLVEPGWSIFLTAATVVNAYSSRLLGTMQSHPWAGPDFETTYRTGAPGNIYFAVNTSRLPAKLAPFALDGLPAFTDGEIIDGSTRTPLDPDDALTTEVPGGGWLILTT